MIVPWKIVDTEKESGQTHEA